jgi:hypothetical protein
LLPPLDPLLEVELFELGLLAGLAGEAELRAGITYVIPMLNFLGHTVYVGTVPVVV